MPFKKYHWRPVAPCLVYTMSEPSVKIAVKTWYPLSPITAKMATNHLTALSQDGGKPYAVSQNNSNT